MNIDANAASGSPASVQKAGAGSARQRAAGDAADNPGATAFMSLLLSIAAPAEDVGMPVVGDPAPSGRGNGSGDGATETPSAEDAALGVVALVNPAVAAKAPGAAMAGDAPAVDAQAAAGAADAQDLQAWTAAADAAAHDGAKRQGAAAATAAAAAALGRQQAAEVAMAATEGISRADAAVSAQDAREDSAWRPLVMPQASANAASVMSMFEAGLVGLRAGPGGRLQERSTARVGTGPDAAGGGFVPWMDAGAGSSVSQAASPVYAPTAATPVAATALAQKLHFWVSGGVQSAQLQLDAFDGGSVDVRIAVKGDEAYVEFHSDLPHARRLLLEAMPQLKELLADEGLMLSGGFVGDSAQRHAEDGSGRRDRPFGAPMAARQGVVEGPTSAAAPVRAAGGSAVDLFV